MRGGKSVGPRLPRLARTLTGLGPLVAEQLSIWSRNAQYAADGQGIGVHGAGGVLPTVRVGARVDDASVALPADGRTPLSPVRAPYVLTTERWRMGDGELGPEKRSTGSGPWHAHLGSSLSLVPQQADLCLQQSMTAHHPHKAVSHSGAPAIRAKGLTRVVLLKTRPQLARLDVWPFLALYVLVLLKIVYHASKFQW